MAKAVYVLCALTSIACAVMLLRAYWRTGTRILLWSSVCFLGFAINNCLLFVDYVVYPDETIVWAAPTVRTLAALVGLACLLYGLIWDSC